jgi:DNA invertase Pin-like site-specific DNA recombinase
MVIGSFVSYIRVSTTRQGESGLGLEAQQEAVRRHVGGSVILDQFVEVESGKSATNRPELKKALEMCKRHKAVLVIAKLDRLARNVHFISGLMESGVEFVACDNPHATKLLVHMLAAFAEHEREQISARTKAALQAAKARGVKLGNPNWEMPLAKAWAARGFQPQNPAVVEMMRQYRSEGLTYRAIAAKLNALDLRTPSDCLWYASTVQRALQAPQPLAVAA